MTWRGSADTKDKFFGALLYLLPLIDVLPFSLPLIGQFPFLAIIYVPLQPVISIYYGFPFASFAIFLILFAAVVRNPNISYFIRFNALQAILMGIAISLVGIIVRWILQPILGEGLLLNTLYNIIALGTLVACFYAIVQSALGKYAELPTISDAAYSQLRW
jgi:uncharacterized membrane protein